MPSFEHLLAFLTATAIFAFVPGPGMLYAATRTLAGGRRIGLMGVLGLALGGYFHVLAATAGLSVVLHAVPTLYAIVKLLGAAYLVWLGATLFRAKLAHVEDTQPAIRKSGRRTFFEGMTVEMLNPKTALFFLAFLPQFVDWSATLPVWTQFFILGSIVNAVFGLADVVAVFLASEITRRAGFTNRTQQTIQKASGGILIALGLRLAVERS